MLAFQESYCMGRRQDRQKNRQEDNIMVWTGLEFAMSQRAAENREKWRKTACSVTHCANKTVVFRHYFARLVTMCVLRITGFPSVLLLFCRDSSYPNCWLCVVMLLLLSPCVLSRKPAFQLTVLNGVVVENSRQASAKSTDDKCWRRLDHARESQMTDLVRKKGSFRRWYGGRLTLMVISRRGLETDVSRRCRLML